MPSESTGNFDPRSLDLAIGGQAVIEGVMMRCPTAIATAVRTPEGRIIVRKRPFRGVTARFRFLNIPFVRGAINLVETMALGIGSLMFSAEQAMVEDEIQSNSSSLKEKLTLFGTMAFAFALSLGLFFYLPLVLTELTGVKDGFRFRGKTYSSLTAVARKVTGAKSISGPFFFGLTKRKATGTSR